MQKIFITSSGTHIGKTLLTCAMIQSLKNSGKKVHAMKPVISGFDMNSYPNDLFYICNSLKIPYDPDNLTKVNFASYMLPLSPDMATDKEKTPQLNYKKLLKFCTAKSYSSNDFLLIETVGGVMVPLNKNHTTLDLISELADKTIMIVGSYLGSLSHTLSAFQVLKNVGKPPVALIVSQNLAPADNLYIPVNDTIKSLENFISVPIISFDTVNGSESLKIDELSKILIDAKISEILG